VALGGLIALGLVCWLVVVPAMRARELLTGVVTRIPDGSLAKYSYAEIVKRLGGPHRAAKALGWYVWGAGLLRPGVDDIESDYRWASISVLERCGEPGTRVIVSLQDDYDEQVRQAAAEVIKMVKAAQASEETQ
jgi:hypothetical protein